MRLAAARHPSVHRDPRDGPPSIVHDPAKEHDGAIRGGRPLGGGGRRGLASGRGQRRASRRFVGRHAPLRRGRRRGRVERPLRGRRGARAANDEEGPEARRDEPEDDDEP